MKQKIDFIGIGAHRCGTSWIANFLRAHPGICLSEPKEVRYFNRSEMQIGKQKGKVNPNFDQSIDWYLRRFAHAKEGQLLGEFSPIYLTDKHAAPAIKSHNPDVRLIVCLRNPVDRAFSLYKLHRGNSIINDISFDKALQQETVYIETGMYAQNLDCYLEHFRKEQILLLIFEELISDPETEFARIFAFLGVDYPTNLDPSKYHTNESVTRRSKMLHKTAFGFSKWLIENGFSTVLVGLRSLGVHSLFNLVNAAPAQKFSISDESRAYLSSVFREDISRLEAMFDVDLGRWK